MRPQTGREIARILDLRRVGYHPRVAILLRIALAGCLAAAAIAAAEVTSILDTLQPALQRIGGDRILHHVQVLASDDFEGRAPGTRGEQLTRDYIAREFERAGLEPGNANGTYFQGVPLVGYRSIPRISVVAGGKPIELGFPTDFVHDAVRLEPRVGIVAHGVIFAGYGIVAPQFGWDDYGDVDVTDKLVIVLSGEPERPLAGEPEAPDPFFFRGDTRTYYATREHKYDAARRRGAAGILVVTDPEKSKTFSIFSTFAKLEGKSLSPPPGEHSLAIAGLLTAQAMRRICDAASVNFDDLEQSARTAGFRARPLGSEARIDIDSKLRSFQSANVVARLTGSDPASAGEYVVFTAHWDHLGTNPALVGDRIFNGASDNAMGVAQLIEISRGFAALKQRPKRSLLFMATTGEESGFLGAKYYVAHPLVLLASTVAEFNLDAGNPFGLTRDLGSAGYGNSTLDEVLAEAARLQGRTFLTESLDGSGSYYFASDQVAFAMAGVPAAFPWSGSDYVGKPAGFGDKAWEDYGDHRYHQVSDEIMPNWDMAGAVEDARWLLIAGYFAANAPARPSWKPGVEFGRPAESQQAPLP